MRQKILSTIVRVSLLVFIMVMTMNVGMGFANAGQSDLQPQVANTPTPPPAPANVRLPQPTPTQLPPINSFDGSAEFLFADFGQPTYVMTYPGISEVYFRLPIQWSLNSPSSITINYDLFDAWLDGTGPQATDPLLNPGQPSVSIYVNEFFAGSFVPVSGENHSYTVEIPVASTTVSNNPVNEYVVRIDFLNDHDPYCNYTGMLTVKDTSKVQLNFSPVQLTLDLANLPIPLTQNSSFLPETLYVIVPDAFSDSDLAAAATVSGIMGRTANANVQVELIKSSQATTQLLQKSNAVVIGRPDNNTFLQNLYSQSGLPTTYSGGTFYNKSTGKPIGKDDGILQITPSPLSPYNTMLVISGGSDVAIQRAANSLAIESIGQEGYLSVVPIDRELPTTNPPSNVIAFSDLGVRDRLYYGLGVNSLSINFFVPRDWQMQEGTALVLNYISSTNLDPKNSSLAVFLNGRPFGSTVLDLSTGEKQISFPIRKEDIITGSINRLQIEAIVSSQLICQYQPRSFWVNIRNSSFLNLPHAIITDPEEASPLTHPIYYLVNQPNVLFSLPPEPTGQDLKAMSNFSLLLGQLGQPYFDYQVSTDPELDLSTRSDENIVMIGRPTKNPQFASINDSLPQPFVSGQDALEEKVTGAIYRLPPDVSIGLMQVIPAPWNPMMGVTVLTATTEQGMDWMIDRATNSNFIRDFFGDIVFIGETTTKAFQSSTLTASLGYIAGALSGTQVPLEVITTPTVMPFPTSLPGEKYTPAAPATANVVNQIMSYALYGLLGLGVLALIIAAVRTIRGGRIN